MSSLDEFERAQAILADLEAAGRVMVNDLVDRLGVSAVTIRKDLDGLEQRAMLRRIRGGAVAAGTSDEGAFEMRLRHARAAKQAIASRAAGLVHDGDVIAIDASTTCFYLAHEILDRRSLVVITNGMKAATLFMEHSSAMVLMPGGVLRRSAGSMVGPIGDVLAGRGRIDKGFFGVKGLSVQHGLMDLAVEEAEAKRYLARSCNEVYGLFDSSKVGRFGLHAFAPTKSVTALYSDEQVNPTVVDEWESVGVPLHMVSPAGSWDVAG